MSNTKAIINFMYFTNNFNQQDLNNIFELMGNATHFKNKFTHAKGNNGIEKLRNLFFELSTDNQEILCDYVNKNYKAFN